MQQGTITALHIARIKGTPSDPVEEARALSGQGLEGDRSCSVSKHPPGFGDGPGRPWTGWMSGRAR